jgi:hypothetical protein
MFDCLIWPYKPSVICLSETWYQVNKPACRLPDYNIVNVLRITRIMSRAGSVCMYIANGIKYSVVHLFGCFDTFECRYSYIKFNINLIAQDWFRLYASCLVNSRLFVLVIPTLCCLRRSGAYLKGPFLVQYTTPPCTLHSCTTSSLSTSCLLITKLMTQTFVMRVWRSFT